MVEVKSLWRGPLEGYILSINNSGEAVANTGEKVHRTLCRLYWREKKKGQALGPVTNDEKGWEIKATQIGSGRTVGVTRYLVTARADTAKNSQKNNKIRKRSRENLIWVAYLQ